MKLAKALLASSLLALAAAGVQAGQSTYKSAAYEIEVTGLPGLTLNKGSTVWQPAPLYPKLALRRGLEGEVLVKYSVDERGQAINIEVLKSSPRGFFNNATVRALESATFAVAYENGEAVPVDGLTKRFVYLIERENSGSKSLVSAY